jgi:hypothetical protein
MLLEKLAAEPSIKRVLGVNMSLVALDAAAWVYCLIPQFKAGLASSRH